MRDPLSGCEQARASRAPRGGEQTGGVVNIVLFGATGNIGKAIAREAVRRGHRVTGVARNSEPNRKLQGVALERGDVTDPASVADVTQGADAVVSAVSPRPGSTGRASPLVDVARGLIAGLEQSGTKRLVVVGGAGSLETPSGTLLMDMPDFPAAYKLEASEQRDALAVYRNEADALDWTVISPAAEIRDGQASGHYRTSPDRLLVDEQGESFISYQDYAKSVIDELEQPHFLKRRFGVAS